MDAARTTKGSDCQCEEFYIPHCEPNPITTGFKYRKSILKYTKIPDCDIRPKEKYQSLNSVGSSLRVRRVVILDDNDNQNTHQISKTDRSIGHRSMSNQIYTITEESTNNVTKKRGTLCIKENKSIELSNSSTISNIKLKSNSIKASPQSPQPSPKNKTKKGNNLIKSKEPSDCSRACKSLAASKNNSLKNKLSSSVDIEIPLKKKTENIKHITPQRSNKVGISSRALPLSPRLSINCMEKHSKHRDSLIHGIKKPAIPTNSIRVNCNKTFKTVQTHGETSVKEALIGHITDEIQTVIKKIKTLNNSKDFSALVKPESSDIEVSTEPSNQVDQFTNMDLDIEKVNFEDAYTSTEKDSIANEFDNLHVPNVSLMIEKLDKSTSVSSLKVGNIKLLPNDSHKLTLPACPLNVISVFKIGKGDAINYVPTQSSQILAKWDPYLTVNRKDGSKLQKMCNKELLKPSEVISAMNLGSGMLGDTYITEQFQMELNFIDSFFESLRYLESCSLSDDNCIARSKHWINDNLELDNSMYYDFLSKLENGDESYTMVSKSLCLLNLLIRDERRRAKNLLFVLKMRESALRDFTKSQIIWLENKKKIDKLDISTLKKKQRGALVKLQHECGEMQRIKKALLALSEKRKAALLKTKKNIELKLNNDVNVRKILQNKKRMRKSASDRTNVPLKCFDLSSSGCEELVRSIPTNSNENMDSFILFEEDSTEHNTVTNLPAVIPMEGVNTVDELSTTAEVVAVEDAPPPPAFSDPPFTQATAENNVIVDGGYLNILFQDIKLPQMFSSGKQYEVNQDAVKKILECDLNKNANLMEEVKDDLKKPVDSTSSPSTARSLVEELDMYYKTLSNIDYSSKDEASSDELQCFKIESQIAEEEKFIAEVDVKENADVKESLGQTGPLPVPVGAPSVSSNNECTNDCSSLSPDYSVTNSNYYEDTSRRPSSTIAISNSNLVDYEAESLRQQQLAIEQEIKALEQQQQLLVREIPDKPPPPYTPPTDVKNPSTWRRIDKAMETRLKTFIESQTIEPLAEQPQDTFDIFTIDYCQEFTERQKVNESELPWDACNMMPKKHKDSTDVVDATEVTEALNDILNCIPRNGGLGPNTSRRVDYIDDILFSEWRRLEPEWTSFQVDEAVVKNQVFESIFNKILTQTAEEYRKTLMDD